MLSIENPPPDLSPCPCEISQHLKSSDDKPQQQQQLDLLKSGLNFSIRDYVYSTRSKDITTNWPFSEENLQLCLKHGVKELLPPFQSIDAVRNRNAKRCAVESISFDKENASSLKEDPSSVDNRVLSVDSSDAKIISVSVNIDRSGSEEDRDFSLTSGGQSCSETSPFPAKKSPYLKLKANTKPEKKVSPASNKVENIVKPVIKKCKLVVKVGSAADQSSKEDYRTNNIPVLETMASKVCPVCKTFSSSSNTTLNAHIDQCLSGESTIKWTANPKVIKHRIKPRRMRTMVDIYSTALPCTLEDLDRRNGTNWASSSSLPARDFEASGLERKQMSPASFEGTENEGAVYVDANGTKVRILSKFDDLPSPLKVGSHIGPKRVLKGDKGGKLHLTKKKKKKHAMKLQRLQKSSPDSKKLCSPGHDHDTEANHGQEQNIAPKEVHEKVHRKVHDDQVKFNESRTMGGWICSKRTGLMKKMKQKNDRQHSTNTKDKESGGEDKELSKENSKTKRGFDVLGGPKFSRKNLHSSPKTNMSSSSEPHDDCMKEFNGRKRSRLSSPGSQACYDRNSSLVLSEDDAKQSRKNGSSAHGNDKDHLNNKANPISSVSDGKVEIKRASTKNTDNCFVNSKQSSSSSHHAFSSKSKKFSSRKNYVSTCQVSTPKSKSNLKRKLFALNKPQVLCVSESDEEAIVWQSGANEPVENSRKVEPPTEKTCDNVTVNRTRVSKVRKDGGKIKISRIEEPMILKDAKLTIGYHEHDNDDKFDSSLGNALAGSIDGKGSAAKADQLRGNDSIVEPAFFMPDGEASRGTSKSSDVRCHDVASRSDVQSDSRQYVDMYNEPFLETEDSRYPVEPIMSSGEIFSMDGDVKNIIRQNIHMMTELDSNDEPGNSYIEVDTIPIPGPPGSFLPSPGRMTSEEFQGNSSLTSSRAQSSEGHPEFAERDFSDSPSATSTISDPDMTKFDSRILEKLQLEHHAFQDEMRSSVSGVSADAVDDNLKPDTHGGHLHAQKFNSDGPKANTSFTEMGSFNFKNEQPCCCSRKEVAVLGAVASNHRESSLLHLQTVSTVPQSTGDEQMNVGARRNFSNCNSMSEVLSSGDLGGGIQNTFKYPLVQIPNKASANSDGESASPCSNPVLRLMGKDLMVINKDENTMPQFRSSQSPMMDNQGNPLSYISSGVYLGNVPKDKPLASHPMVSHGPTFTRNREHYDVIPANGYSKGDYDPPQRNSRGSLLMLPGSMPESCSSALESREYTHGCYFPTEQLRAMNRFGTPLRCDNEKAVTSPVQGQNANSSVQNTKEIIIIDDAPENAADYAALSIKSVVVTSGFNPRNVDPFYGYQPPTSSPFERPPLTQTATSQQMPYSVGVSSSPIKWNCVPEPAFPSSSPHANHRRSTLYHSRGFS